MHSVSSSLLAAKGDIAGAIEEVQKAITLAPDRWQLYLSLALLQQGNHQPDAAQSSLQKVIELEPASSQARCLREAYQSIRRYEAAERQFRDAIDVDPKNLEPRAALARLYLSQR